MVDVRALTEDEEIEALVASIHAEEPTENTLYLLPDGTDAAGNYYLYRDDVAGMVKVVRSGKCDLRFGAPSAKRRYLSEYGALDEVIVAISLGVIGNLTYDLIKSIYLILSERLRATLGPGHEDEGKLNLRVAEIELTPHGRIIRGLEATGSLDEVDACLRTMLRESGGVE